MGKIQVGYCDGGRGNNKKGAYGGANNGKLKHNGGFNRQPTVDYTRVTEERWKEIDWSK